jgi:uncharacterized protein with PQ loop repeat
LLKIHSIYNGNLLKDLKRKHTGDIMNFIKKYLKWVSTFFVLTGILLTNLNIYPLNILSHGLGVVGWTISGIANKDKAIMTNFGLQLPLFIIGYINLFF